MRRAARVDRNHSEIIGAFRAMGFSVADTSRLGFGVVDEIWLTRRDARLLVKMINESLDATKRK